MKYAQSLIDSAIFTIVVPDVLAAPEIADIKVFVGNVVMLTWSSEPGAVYRVQYKRTLSETGWSDIGAPIQATGTTSSTMDTPLEISEGYYRIVRIP